MDNQATTTVKPTKSLLYWRKSKINGAATVPVVLALDESGTFSMKGADGDTIFSTPAQNTAVQFTNWGTMVVDTNGTHYDIVGVGASLSPNPSQAQLDEINASTGSNASGDTNLSRVGSVGAAVSGAGGIGAAAGVAGSAAMQYAYYQGLEAIKAWQEILPAAGATVKKSSMNAMKYFTIGIAVLVVLALVIGLLNRQ